MDDLDLAHMRMTYRRAELREDDLDPNPITQIQAWIAQAVESKVPEPNAMMLATAGGAQPSARIVLLRGLDERGLVFFTSYGSRKGRELAANPRAAVLFFWPQLERQIRVEGLVDYLPEEESDAYFASRPRGHRLAAWASEQSEPVERRSLLEQRMTDYGVRFEGDEIARPHSWGGYVLHPERAEFWQGRPDRMHDRIEFNQASGRWQMRRLQP